MKTDKRFAVYFLVLGFLSLSSGWYVASVFYLSVCVFMSKYIRKYEIEIRDEQPSILTFTGLGE